MALQFRKATKAKAKLRLALIGTAGTGKTYTALALASALGQRVAVVDTEHGSASKYSDVFAFDVIEPESFEPEMYTDALRAAYNAGYDVVVLDSLSHAWAGRGGLLEFVENERQRSKTKDGFSAWRGATPRHNELIEQMLACPMHLIVTMRAKTEYVMDKDERTGKTTVTKVGLQPVQRDGLDYEFDVVGDMTTENDLIVGKTRCPALKRKVFHEPGQELAEILLGWLDAGEERPTSERPPRQLAEVPDEPSPAPKPKAATATDPKTARRLRALMGKLAKADDPDSADAAWSDLWEAYEAARQDGTLRRGGSTDFDALALLLRKANSDATIGLLYGRLGNLYRRAVEHDVAPTGEMETAVVEALAGAREHLQAREQAAAEAEDPFAEDDHDGAPSDAAGEE